MGHPGAAFGALLLADRTGRPDHGRSHSIRPSARGGKRRPTRSMQPFRISAGSSSRPIPRGSRVPSTTGALTPKVPMSIADALRPHGGVVLWRAFVYSERDATDRAMQAYRQLQPLDGAFADNVVLQVKNGPVDFQPREPFHPLFGAMPRTNAGSRAADHEGVPRLRHAPGLPGSAVSGSTAGGYRRSPVAQRWPG